MPDKNNVMRQKYKQLTDEDRLKIQNIKDAGLMFYEYIESCGESRELSIAKTKIEEAVMWSIKHVTK